MFISFEGIEGCGKTSHLKLLADWLSHKGYSCFITREPGGTEIGDHIRSILLSTSYQNMHPLTETLLYLASRVQLINQLILPSLKEGRIVLSDRFSDSTLAYQGFGRGIKLEILQQLSHLAGITIKPDLTFLLDIEPETGIQRVRRLKGGLDRIEEEEIEFHSRVRAGFLKLAELEPERFVVLNTAEPMEEVHRKIVHICIQKFKLMEKK